MRTKAAILFETNKPLIIDEVEIPKLKRGQALVKIFASGICRAQYNEIIALKGPDRYLPHLLGHEASGEVVEVGEEVKKVKSGDFVVCTWIKGKGLDGIATEYSYQGRIINAGGITTFSEFAVISENRLVKISKKVPPDVAAVLGCAIPTGVGIILRTLKVQKGSSIAIFGVGGVGSSVILGAKMAGCSSIIAVDIAESKLAFARILGANHTIHVLKENIAERIKKITGKGVDYAVEASGNKQAMESAFEVLVDKGKLAIAGNLKKGEKICIIPFDLIKGKKIMGTWGGETKTDIDIPYYARKYLSGDLKVDKLITQRLRFEEINKAFDDMKENKIKGRAVIEFI